MIYYIIPVIKGHQDQAKTNLITSLPLVRVPLGLYLFLLQCSQPSSECPDAHLGAVPRGLTE